MPYSSSEGKGFFEDWLFHFMANGFIRTMFDVGVGSGEYGRIFNRAGGNAKQYNDTDFLVRGCEIFDPYISRHRTQTIYDDVLRADIREIAGHLADYDLIVMGDVLEHMTYGEGLVVINKLKQRCKFLWISTPMAPMDRSWSVGYKQGEHEWQENINEKHLHDWTEDELLSLDPLWLVPYSVVAITLVEGDL